VLHICSRGQPREGSRYNSMLGRFDTGIPQLLGAECGPQRSTIALTKHQHIWHRGRGMRLPNNWPANVAYSSVYVWDTPHVNKVRREASLHARLPGVEASPQIPTSMRVSCGSLHDCRGDGCVPFALLLVTLAARGR